MREINSQDNCPRLSIAYIQKAGILGQRKVLSLGQGLVIEVGSHEVGNRHNKGCNLGEMTLVAIVRVVELKFDHVAIVTVTKKEKKDHRVVLDQESGREQRSSIVIALPLHISTY